MIRRVCLAVAAGIAATMIGPGMAQAADDSVPEGFTRLFNGEDLTGWDGDARLWRVEHGEIVGSTEGHAIEHNSFLFAEKPYRDFELHVEVKLRNHNSGIQFRSEKNEGYRAAGYQADVAEATYFGMLYEEQKRGFMDYWKALTDEERAAIPALAKQGDWNAFVIRCEGDHIVMKLNGETVCDITDPEGAKEGYIALQLHTGPPMEVRFRNIYIKELTPSELTLIPNFDDETRRERLEVAGPRFRLPAGFTVEEVAPNDLTGSLINMAFDPQGRPAVSVERGGIYVLLDTDGDGHYDAMHEFANQTSSAQGMHYLGVGDLLVHANGPEGAGLYRLTDTDGDDRADIVRLVAKSDGGIGEHGPHAIEEGLDGALYIMFGNHSLPDVALDPNSPLGHTDEDHLLPRYVDPRGHATQVRAPGGTLHRFDPVTGDWARLAGGFRNAYDFSINAEGEFFTFDSDMEWDRGLPWFRPIRVVHVVPGADYGWRTGSSKMPFYYIDTLPSIDDVGRGSPVGTAIYDHTQFPLPYRGAYFMGDWSRGRIRVLFPERDGATYAGKTLDFLVGEPLNVTDLDIAPSGALYFAVGGRGTHGGMFRVTYTGADGGTPAATDGIAAVLEQPMPRSAWGRAAWRKAKAHMGEKWARELRGAAENPALDGIDRVRALEALQALGPKPNRRLLTQLSTDHDPAVRAAAVLLLGTFPLQQVDEPLVAALRDADALVARRACEALVRAGLNPMALTASSAAAATPLVDLLGHGDRFVRYAARVALARTPREAWADAILEADAATSPQRVLEGLLALTYTQRSAQDADAIFSKLESLSQADLDDEALLDYLRVVQLAFIRDVAPVERPDNNGPEIDRRAAFRAAVGPRLLAQFPRGDWRVNRELQVVIAHMEPAGAPGALLAYLTPDKSQEEQIHTIYCLRTIQTGWTPEQRKTLVAWFDRGRQMGGAASMSGFIDNLWASSLELLTEDEKTWAVARKEEALRKEAEAALALMNAAMEDAPQGRSELAQMSFDEMAEYLEYDPMAYNPGTEERGKRVFVRARCADCHVFGEIGKGGGPDLSTVVSRFRRRDILEAIMYPSRVVSDQYTSVELELDDFTDLVGMVASETDDTLTVITVQGERHDVSKAKIVERRASDKSVMPEGLLDTMSLGDLVGLINFLEKGSDS